MIWDKFAVNVRNMLGLLCIQLFISQNRLVHIYNTRNMDLAHANFVPHLRVMIHSCIASAVQNVLICGCPSILLIPKGEEIEEMKVRIQELFTISYWRGLFIICSHLLGSH